MRSGPVDDRLAQLQRRLLEFRDARNWRQFHSPKNLSMALAAEAGELLAEFQWLTETESTEAGNAGPLRDRVMDEMADVMIYLSLLAEALGIDLIKAASSKVERNEARFPPE